MSDQNISEALVLREIRQSNETLENKLSRQLEAVERRMDLNAREVSASYAQTAATLVGLQAEITAERERCAREIVRLDADMARQAARTDEHEAETGRWRRWMIGSGVAGGGVAAGLAKLLGLGGGPPNG